MKERVVMLFLFAIGTYKVYENSNSDDDWESPIEPIKHRINKRSINNMLEEWSNEKIIDEELLEAVNTRLNDNLRSKCSEVVNNECSCRRLVCFDESDCRKSDGPVTINESDPKSTIFNEVRCRQTIIFGQRLCECKKYKIMNSSRTTTGDDSTGGSSNNHQIKQPPQPILGVGDRFSADRSKFRLSGE